ncbi:MAG: phytanoyl-CoA dioxygenase [Robiginitomaculum sp.]|nr:MAG: phytanoyl-CoA dioxygenase [Robiginitomaculum sp.]
MLTQQQIQDYHANGYLVLPGFKSADELAVLKNRAIEIANGHDINIHKTIFSTGEQRQENIDPEHIDPEHIDAEQGYFLNSANGICCFLEEKAFDKAGALVQSLPQSINKIGHALHDLDPVFDTFSRGDKLAQLAKDLGLNDAQIWQSMYIFKQPRIGGKVDWHQDASFFQTDPITVTTFWFAIDDATLENGCLWVQDGGHNSPLREVFTRDGDVTTMTSIDDTPWPEISEARAVEVKAGTLVCFQGRLPHYSAENLSDKARHAYTLHVTDSTSKYAPENWIQRSADFPAHGFS